jgi:DNA-binding response OmpR family regulator
MNNKPHILIADDELIERQTLSDILRLEGYHVSTVANGEAAVDFIRMHPVDLVVLDLRMPGMSGLDVVKVVARIQPETEIILLTAHGSMESAIEALRSRVHDYLLKPAAPAQIVDTIRQGLERREARLRANLSDEVEPTLEEHAVIKLEEGITVDFGRRSIHWRGKTIYLTPAEARLFRVFVENIGKVFSHRELVLLVQGYAASPLEAPEILRPLVSRLRQKLEGQPSLMNRIVSVRGTGYVFEQPKPKKT